jgi:endonuclease-3 related protein
MLSLEESYPAMVAALANRFGQPQPPREAASPFESVLAEGLSRATSATQTDAVISALDCSGLLRPGVLAALDAAELVDVLAAAGVSIAARTALLLKRLAAWCADAFSDATDPAENPVPPTSRLRADLLAIHGIGQATADAILLALGRPRYPVDHSAYRILVRHGWIDPSAVYDEVHDLLTGRARQDPAEIARLSWWLGAVGHHYCGRSSPKCERCPLREFLPETGPLEPDS